MLHLPGRMGPVIAIFLGLFGVTATVVAQNPPAMVSCAQDTTAAYHYLDFWVGDWKAYDNQGNHQLGGTDRISKILDGCALMEDWTDVDGTKGQGLFYYDPQIRLWKMVWLTPFANSPGGLKEKRQVARYPDGAIRMQGEIRGPKGVTLDRTTIYPLPTGKVRYTIEISRDGGNEWQMAFDAEYRRGP